MTATDVIAVASISGGKDSTETARRAIERLGPDRVRLVHADTGNEHAITESYIRDYLPGALGLPIDIVRADFAKDIARKRRYVEEKWPEKGVPSEICDRALSVLHPTGIPFLDLCLWKGRFPSRRAQFCTQELKRRPLDAYMADLMLAGHQLESWQGIRRDESQNRKDALAREDVPEGWTIVRPIVDWTAQQVVDSLQANGIMLNPLYSQGCTRVGCMLCINAGKDEIANAAARWPQHIDKIREWERLVSLAAKRGWTTFFCDGLKEGETDAEIFDRLRIDQRVLWAKTTRGGTQFDLLKSEAPPMCSSSYGLCE